MQAFSEMLLADQDRLESELMFEKAHQGAVVEKYETWAVADRLMQSFVPGTLSAPIHSFWAEQTLAQGYGETDWLAHTKNKSGSTINILPGDHYTFVFGSNARSIGRALNDLLRAEPKDGERTSLSASESFRRS